MPIGKHAPRRGFTYLLLLFGVALAGAALARLGTHWQQVAQREAEAELLFRGEQYRQALQRYVQATPSGQAALPRELDELLTDLRGPRPLHHLRRLWPDPVTRQADWLLQRDARGGIYGLRSRSHRPALRQVDTPVVVATRTDPATGRPVATPDPTVTVGDWLFAVAIPAAAPPPPADPVSPTRKTR